MVEQIEGLMARGEWELAEHHCSNFLGEQPNSPKVLAYLGLCKFRKNDFVGASEQFGLAYRLQPVFWEAGLKYAQCLDRCQKYAEALDVARNIRPLRPNDPVLTVLINGLERQVVEEKAPGWEKGTEVRHNIYLSND